MGEHAKGVPSAAARRIDLEEQDGFYTLNGYRHQSGEALTASMEDYLEMICRVLDADGYVRVKTLSEMLHVRPSSASKMVANLKNAGYLCCERYGYIALTELGRNAGKYLLRRHEVLERFFRLLNGTENELEQVEKIEHFIDRRTVENLEKLTAVLAKDS